MTGTASALTTFTLYLKINSAGRRLNGSVTFDRRKGTSPVLTNTEATQANQLVDWLIELWLVEGCLPYGPRNEKG